MKFRAMAIALVSALSLSSLSFAAAAPLSGDFEDPAWAGNQALVAKKVADEGTQYYLIHTDGSSKLLLDSSANATEVSVSKDGSKIAYVNDNGDIYVMDMATSKSDLVTSDHDPKMELQFNDSGSKIYFLAGDKIDKLSVIDLSEKKTTALVSDGVAYKSDLRVSADESKAAYVVTAAGKVDETSGEYGVDSKGTEPQIYSVNLNGTDKPVKLTDSTDNKVFTNMTQNNEVIYVSADPDKDGMPLMKMDNQKMNHVWVGHLNVYGVSVLNDGSVLVVGDNLMYGKSLFSVGSNGVTKRIAALPEDATAVVAKDMSHIAVTVSTDMGEKIMLLNGGKLVDLTK